ncbi:MAG: GNAT family N-acetyltransferase [Candidatus Nanopelagicales bacterium]|nr:GNAT family N-acetyltransferase [Candidatus Nanopelagicales bacterium]
MIRPVRPDDIDELLEMVRELAEYEQAADQFIATHQSYHQLFFGDNPAVFAVVVGQPGPGHRLAGFAIYFRNFSTWLGKHGIYLEDLYVRPQYRGHGYGKSLLAYLARECLTKGYGRLEWWVLDWNDPALGFYRSLGAEPMSDWTVHRITGNDLVNLAGYEGEP